MDAVTAHLIQLVQYVYAVWVYVYDETKSKKTSKWQWRLHFFRNFSFQRHSINQSKVQFGALGLLCETATGWMLFPVWMKLMCPKMIRDKSNAVLQRIVSKLVPGLIIFDRGFARRKVFTMVLRFGHHILCRAKSNAVLYHLPKMPKQRKPGRPKKYGDRLNVPRLRYNLMEIEGRTHSVASKVVRTNSACVMLIYACEWGKRYFLQVANKNHTRRILHTFFGKSTIRILKRIPETNKIVQTLVHS